MTEAEVRVMWLQPKECGQPRKLEKARNRWILPWNLQKEYGSADTLMLNPFLTPDLQTNKLILP